MGELDGLRDEVREAQTIADLKRTNARLLRNLDKAKSRNADIQTAVHEAMVDGLSSLEMPPVTPPKKDRRRHGEEVAVVWCSDWQLAKVTPSYNTEVCEDRIGLFAEKVTELTDIQRADHPVKRCHLWLTGDIIEGELIFPGQAHLIDASLYRQVTVDGPRILGNLIRQLLSDFETVHVAAVIGNHGALGGRARRDYNPESNGDRMLYRIVQHMFADEPRVTWDIPDGPNERNWYTVDRIGNYSCLLFHGDQMRGHAGFPWYGLAKKVWGWKAGAIEEEFRDAAFGHWHQPTRVTLNTVTARCCGSTESHNTFAQEQLAAVGRPSQWLLFVHPERGRVTAEYCVYLD